jgi:GxxExxY protein
MNENEIAKIVFNLGLKVHRALGPGLLESAYQECLWYEINKAGLKVEKQKALPLVYEDVRLDIGYRIDLLIENKFKLGLLINFNTVLFKDGVKRVINGIL